MNSMESAIYRSGAHIVFKQLSATAKSKTPTNRLKVPVPIWRKRKITSKANQRVIGGIALDPVNRQAAIVTSPTPLDCRPIN